MYKIIQYVETDYDPNSNKTELEELVKELNQDVVDDPDHPARWMVVEVQN